MMVRRSKNQTPFYHNTSEITASDASGYSLRGGRDIALLMSEKLSHMFLERYGKSDFRKSIRIYDFMRNRFGSGETIHMKNRVTYIKHVLSYKDISYVVLSKRDSATYDEYHIYVLTGEVSDERYFSNIALQRLMIEETEHFLVDFLDMRDDYYKESQPPTAENPNETQV